MFWGLLGAFIGVGFALGTLAFVIVRICVFLYRLIRGQLRFRYCNINFYDVQ